MKTTLPLLVVGILVFSGLGAIALPEPEKTKSLSISQPTFIDEYDLIIISPNQFSTELQPLIDHKNNRGVQTILIYCLWFIVRVRNAISTVHRLAIYKKL